MAPGSFKRTGRSHFGSSRRGSPALRGTLSAGPLLREELRPSPILFVISWPWATMAPSGNAPWKQAATAGVVHGSAGRGGEPTSNPNTPPWEPHRRTRRFRGGKQQWRCWGLSGCGYAANSVDDWLCTKCGAPWSFKARKKFFEQDRTKAAREGGQPPQYPWRLAAPTANGDSDDKEEARRLQAVLDCLSRQLGNDHELTKKVQQDLHAVRTKLQNSKPVLVQLQQAQTHLRKMEAQFVREHQEFEVLVLQIEQMHRDKELRYKQGVATRRLRD